MDYWEGTYEQAQFDFFIVLGIIVVLDLAMSTTMVW